MLLTSNLLYLYSVILLSEVFNFVSTFQPIVSEDGPELRKMITLTFETVILLAISCEVIHDSACLYCSALGGG